MGVNKDLENAPVLKAESWSVIAEEMVDSRLGKEIPFSKFVKNVVESYAEVETDLKKQAIKQVEIKKFVVSAELNAPDFGIACEHPRRHKPMVDNA